MSTTALELREPQQAIYQWKSPTAIKQRIIAIQQLMQDVLKPGNRGNEFSGDYGIIPGTGNKPSLWKSGSEQILAMFEIAVEPIVEDLSTEDCFRYRVTTRLTHAPTGIFLGAGIGEASSNETKYKWRKTFSQKEFEATAPDRRRIKYGQYKDGNGMWADKEEWQVRTEPADIANTILKMSKKRSQIDGTLTVTGASSMFGQDLDDLLEDQVIDGEEKPEKKTAKPQASVKCSECKAEGGHLPGCSKRQQSAKPAAEVKKAVEVPPPAEKPVPKQEGPTICSECRSTSGHKPDCKFTPKPKVEDKAQPPALCSIRSVIQKQKTGTKEPFLVLNVIATDGQEGKLYCWDKKMFDHLVGCKDTTLLCNVTSQKTNDGKIFFQLDEILELGGIQFKDNKPLAKVDSVATEEGGIEDLFT